MQESFALEHRRELIVDAFEKLLDGRTVTCWKDEYCWNDDIILFFVPYLTSVYFLVVISQSHFYHLVFYEKVIYEKAENKASVIVKTKATPASTKELKE